MDKIKIEGHLCYYDIRNPDGVKSFLTDQEIKEEGLGKFSKENCSCDNCFYDRKDMAEQLLEASKKQKELSMLCCIIRDNEIFGGTLFKNFDKIFEIAKAFVEEYGVDKIPWGIEMEYEDTVIHFATNYKKEKWELNRNK